MKRITRSIWIAITMCVATLCATTTSATQVETAYMTATRYNVAGQVTGVIKPDPDGGGALRLLATRNSYDTTGLLVKVEQGQLTSWPDESVDPTTWTTYGFSGTNLFSTTVISYDGYGRKIQEYTKGRDGVTIESEVEYSYDNVSHVLCKAVRMNKTAFSGAYVDACSQRSQGTEPDRIFKYTYDSLDHVLTEERGVGTALDEIYVTNTYGCGQQLASQTDANGNRTELRYDSYCRLQKRVYPSKVTAGLVNESDYNQYTYDANGNGVQERKRDGRTITNSYDANNRLTFKDLSDNTYQSDVSFNYDARGLMLSARFVNDSGAGITTSYDGFGRIVSSANNMSGTSRQLNYQYDNNGNRTRITHPDSWFFQYEFDGLNRVNALNESTAANSGAGTTSLLTVVYQSNGSPSYVSRNGTTSVTSVTLDNANRQQTLYHDFPGATNDLTNTFAYNAASQIVQLDQSNNTYSYMGNDNKTGAYVVNGLNQYTSINGAAVTYDNNGNETADSTTSYVYDMENRLVAASAAGLSATFTYDPQGRLFQSTINGTTTQFLYDNTALVAEYVGGVVTKRYVHGDQVDQPLVQYTGTSVSPAGRQYFHADHQGSIIALSDNAGNVITKYTYDNFGIPGNASNYRFAYTGQLWFKDIKLYYYKARFYSPYQGRFMQTDPIYYKDDMDLYSYVGNDPMDKTDPMGLTEYDCNKTCDGNAKMKAGDNIKIGNATIHILGAKNGAVQYSVDTKTSCGATREYTPTATVNAPGASSVPTAGSAADMTSVASKTAFAYSHVFAGMEFLAGRTTIGSNGRLYRSGWGGGSRGGITTYRLANIGKAGGVVVAGAGFATDYIDYSNGNMSRGKFEANTSVGAATLVIGGPFGWAAGTTYYLWDQYDQYQQAHKPSVMDSVE